LQSEGSCTSKFANYDDPHMHTILRHLEEIAYSNHTTAMLVERAARVKLQTPQIETSDLVQFGGFESKPAILAEVSWMLMLSVDIARSSTFLTAPERSFGR